MKKKKDYEQLFRVISGLVKRKSLNLVTKIRKNMKSKAMRAFDKAMLRKRAVIESVNGPLKNISHIEILGTVRHSALW